MTRQCQITTTETHMARLTSVARKIAAPVLRPVWRRLWAHIEARVGPIDARLGALEHGWRQNIPAFLNAVNMVSAFGRDLARQGNELTSQGQTLSAVGGDISRIWDRIEFVRREIMYEMAHGPGSRAAAPEEKTQSRTLAPEKVAAAAAEGALRVNLGCGHIALPDYINVDMRDLPGVDVIAEVDDLPFDKGSVDEVFS